MFEHPVGSTTVGSLKLTAWDEEVHGALGLVPPYPALRPHPAGGGSWVPIEIEGVVRTYSWDDEGLSTVFQTIARVASLLSLAWGSCWRLQDGPVRPPPHPSGIPLRKRALLRPFEPQPDIRYPGQRAFPSWLGDAFAAVESDPNLERVLLMHHEGLALLADHPSFALLAFVSVIERVGEVTKGLERCKECNQVRGSRRRFRTASARVLDDADAAAMTRAYDSARSPTTHAAVLHGREPALGFQTFGDVLRPPSPSLFRGRWLGLAKTASRRLVAQQLGDVLGQTLDLDPSPGEPAT